MSSLVSFTDRQPMVDEGVQTDSESSGSSQGSYSGSSSGCSHSSRVPAPGFGESGWAAYNHQQSPGSEGYGSIGMASSNGTGSDGSEIQLTPHEFENLTLQNKCIEVAEHLLRSHVLRVADIPEVPDCSRAMLRKVADILGRHKELFDGFLIRIEQDNIKVASSTSIELYAILEGVAEELFENEQAVNWGRIVAFYAFGARLAQAIIAGTGGGLSEQTRTMARTMISDLSYLIGVCVSEKTGYWIEEHGGGWEYFAACFGSEKLVGETDADDSHSQQMSLRNDPESTSLTNKTLTTIAVTAGVGVGLGLLGLSLRQ